MLHELLIRTVEKGDRLRGHVIAIMPSPHQWGREEIANPDWQIVKAELADVEVHALLAPGPAGEFRALRVNLDGWTGGMMSRAEITARAV